MIRAGRSFTANPITLEVVEDMEGLNTNDFVGTEEADKIMGEARLVTEVVGKKIKKADKEKSSDKDSQLQYVKEYEEETGKNAIWQGEVTKGYRDWVKKNK